ncbi:MAG: hypothetical protein CR991_10975 [Proteobacteria bacterium]|nr:MAG: hypothetical protein CR991_10975 [Pseudomonadota bacterium]
MKKAIWLSYDLGVRGDYEGLYAWLDDHQAIECGDSVAFLNFNVKDTENIIEELKRDLQKSVNFNKRDRIYIIWKIHKKIKGRFIFGKRKASPWEGYGSQESETEEVE